MQSCAASIREKLVKESCHIVDRKLHLHAIQMAKERSLSSQPLLDTGLDL